MSLSKRLLNRTKDLLFIPGSESLWLNHLKGKIICLLYHRVGIKDEQPWLTRGGSPFTSIAELRSDIALHKNLGAEFFTFADLLQGKFAKTNGYGVIVCFDDCFVGNYADGLDLLNDLNIRATFFQCSAMVSGDELLCEHALCWIEDSPVRRALLANTLSKHDIQLGESLFLETPGLKYSRTELQDLVTSVLTETDSLQTTQNLVPTIYPKPGDLIRAVKSGHEIASHGHAHIPRAMLTTTEFENELTTSKKLLNNIVDKEITAFSYPFNQYLPADKERCAKVYQQTATVDAALIDVESDPLAMPRFTWPGPAKNSLRQRRWLLTGTI